jgi:PAS domain S-box-containing protein
MRFVLVVSNDIETYEIIKRSLETHFQVLIARCGKDALVLLMQNPVDVIFIDSFLSDYKGLSFVKILKERQIIVPVVLILSADQSIMTEPDFDPADLELLFRPIQPAAVDLITRKALDKKETLKKLNYLEKRVESPFNPPAATPCSTQFFNSHYGHDMPVEKAFIDQQYNLRQLMQALTHVANLEKLLDDTIKRIADLFGVNIASILVLNEQRSHYVIAASIGLDDLTVKSVCFEATDIFPCWFLKYNQILRKEELLDHIFHPDAMHITRQMERIKAVVSSPLLSRGKLVGILSLGNKVVGRPFFDADLELLSMISYYAGISIENALLYREVTLQKQYNENILRNITSGVITIDRQGIITTLNKSAESILKVSSQEMLGQPIQKLGSIFADIMLRTLEGSKTFHRHEVPHPLTKGPIGVSTSQLIDENQRVQGAVMVFTDLTETKELEQKNQTLERLRFWSSLSNRLAQEIRNPLVAIKTFAQLLPQRCHDEEFRNEFYEIVKQEIDRLGQIAQKLMQFAQPKESQFETIDINDLVRQAIIDHEKKILKKKIKIYKKLEERPLLVKADRRNLMEALSNLIDNSLDALPEGGRLKIRTSCQNESQEGIPASDSQHTPIVKIEVEDTGCGIPREHMKDIFSPFFSTKTSGMGFGLPIAERIILDHKGKIEVVSHLGKGSKFRVLLPAIRRDVA